MSGDARGGWRMDSTAAARLALGGLSVLVLLLSLGFAVTVSAIVARSERMLESNLATAAALLSQAFPQDSLFVLNISYDPVSGTTDLETFRDYIEQDLPVAGAFETAVREAASRRQGVDLRVLSPGGVTLYGGDGAVLTGEAAPYAAEDSALVDIAASGVPSTSDRDGRSPLRLYQPIANQDGDVIALLQIVAEPTYGAWSRRLQRRVLLTAALSVLLIVVLWIVVSRMIARIRKAEKAADQSDRLRALGTATAGIAHEIRNPLSIIGLSIEEIAALSADVDDERLRAQLKASAGELAGECRRLRDLTDQFLDFVREKPDAAEAQLDLGAAAERVVQLYAKGLPSRIRLEFAPAKEPLPVVFGEGRLRQVLLNVLRNAEEAIGDGDGSIRVTASRQKGDCVLTVEDDGPGVPPEVLAQAFDPFFTTRPEGTGLGLPLSRALVEAAGGSFDMESAPGKGARIVISLPFHGDTTPSGRLPRAAVRGRV